MRIIKSVIAFLLICGTANATEITVNGGLLHTNNSNYSDGVSSNVRLENPIYKNLNGGVEYGFHGPTRHYPENDGEHDYGSMYGHSVLGELIYYFPIKEKFKLFILGGLGWSFWSFNRSQEVRDLGISVDMGNSFAKKVCIGGDYKINELWAFNAEFSYFQSHVPKDAKESDGSNSIILTDEKTIGQEEICIVAGLKYKF